MGTIPPLVSFFQDLSRAVHSHGLELSVEELRDMAGPGGSVPFMVTLGE